MKAHRRVNDKMSNYQKFVSYDESFLCLAWDGPLSTLQVIDRQHLITNYDFLNSLTVHKLPPQPTIASRYSILPHDRVMRHLTQSVFLTIPITTKLDFPIQR